MWLTCRATFGRGKNKVLVRGVKGAEWVFCPSIKSMKRGKVSIERCKNCKYFVHLEQTYVAETRSTKRTSFLKMAPSKACFHIAKSHYGPRITRPHVALSPHIPALINERQPLFDTFEEGDHLIVLAELPSIDEKDLTIRTSEDTVMIIAENAKKKYLKIVKLPTRIKKDTMEYSYRNNILQVKMEKLRADQSF